MRKILDSCFQVIVSFENLVLRIYRALHSIGVFVQENGKGIKRERESESDCIPVCFWHRINIGKKNCVVFVHSRVFDAKLRKFHKSRGSKIDCLTSVICD